MLKKLLLFLLLVPFMAVAQSSNNTGIPIPMKSNKIWYEKSYTVSAKKAALYSIALKWFKSEFKYPGYSIDLSDENAGQIDGTGIFKIITSDNGNYYWLRVKITITVANGSYTIKTTDFYEKPIEAGISNEYSKIEYRWWDFRQGKPWSAEDKALFTGLDSSTTSMMASLEKAMSK